MSRIIRGADGPPAADPERTPPATPRVIRAAVFDARTEAEQIVSAAREEADRLISEARTLAAALREEGRALGLRAGREEAAALIVAARARREAALEDLTPDVARLAVRVAERLLDEALALDPSRVTSVCRHALEHARRARDVTMRVSPDDAGAVEEARAKLASTLRAQVPLRIAPDPSIARGGCVLETDVGTIDGRVETQLAAIERALLGAGLGSDRA